MFSQLSVCPRGRGVPLVTGSRSFPSGYPPSPATGPVQSSVLGPALGRRVPQPG